MYLLFYGRIYYPSGGARDFRGAFDTIDEAMAAFESSEYEHGGFGWAHITDDGLNILLRYDRFDDDEKWKEKRQPERS